MIETIGMDTIRAISQLIANHFKVERIVLFGSYAREDAKTNSDIDLLVEMRSENLPTGPGNPIRRLIAEHFVVPIDVVVQSTETVNAHHDKPYSLTHQALSEGIVLYDRQIQTLV